MTCRATSDLIYTQLVYEEHGQQRDAVLITVASDVAAALEDLPGVAIYDPYRGLDVPVEVGLMAISLSADVVSFYVARDELRTACDAFLARIRGAGHSTTRLSVKRQGVSLSLTINGDTQPEDLQALILTALEAADPPGPDLPES